MGLLHLATAKSQRLPEDPQPRPSDLAMIKSDQNVSNLKLGNLKSQ